MEFFTHELANIIIVNYMHTNEIKLCVGNRQFQECAWFTMETHNDMDTYTGSSLGLPSYCVGASKTSLTMVSKAV